MREGWVFLTITMSALQIMQGANLGRIPRRPMHSPVARMAPSPGLAQCAPISRSLTRRWYSAKSHSPRGSRFWFQGWGLDRRKSGCRVRAEGPKRGGRGARGQWRGRETTTSLPQQKHVEHEVIQLARQNRWGAAMKELQRLERNRGIYSPSAAVYSALVKMNEGPGPMYWMERGERRGLTVNQTLVGASIDGMQSKDWKTAVSIMRVLYDKGIMLNSRLKQKLLTTLLMSNCLPPPTTLLRLLCYADPPLPLPPNPRNPTSLMRAIFGKFTEEKGGGLSPSMFAILLEHVKERKLGWWEAIDVWHAAKENCIPSLRLIMGILDVCKPIHKWRIAQQIVDDMESRKGVSLDAKVYNSLLNVYKLEVEALNKYDNQMKEGKSFQVYKRAVNVLEQMARSHVKPDTSVYRTLMSFPVTPSQFWAKAFGLYQDMKSQAVDPTPEVFLTLTGAIGRAVSVDVEKYTLLNRVMEEMAYHKCPLTIRICNSMITVYGRAKQPDKALDMFNQITTSTLKHTDVSYAALIDAYAKSALWEKALSVFAEMRQFIGISREAGGAVVKALCMAGEWNRAIAMFSTLKREKKATEVSGRHLVCALVKAKRWEEALEMRSFFSFKSLDQTTVAGLICAAAKGRRVDLAMELLQQLGDQKMRPDPIIYTALVDACGRTNRMNIAIRVFREMISRGIMPDLISCNALLSGCARRGWGNLASRTHKFMSAIGVTLNANTYSQLIYAQSGKGHYRKAQFFFDRMVEEGFEPQRTHYNGLIRAYTMGHQFQDSLEIYTQMKNNQIMPDDSTYQSLLREAHAYDPVDHPLVEPHGTPDEIRSLVDLFEDIEYEILPVPATTTLSTTPPSRVAPKRGAPEPHMNDFYQIDAEDQFPDSLSNDSFLNDENAEYLRSLTKDGSELPEEASDPIEAYLMWRTRNG
ncbi:hypothetical protein AAMO2058_001345400 [Amorphochlora amoebiformis]